MLTRPSVCTISVDRLSSKMNYTSQLRLVPSTQIFKIQHKKYNRFNFYT